MNRGAWLRWGLGLALSAVFVWLAYRGTDVQDIARRIASAKPADFALSILAFLAASVLRSYRWQLCFEGSDRVSFAESFGAYGLGALSTQVIPARLGDLIRVYVLGQSSGVSKSKGLGTLVIERLADLLTVVVLMAFLAPLFALPAWITAGTLFAAVAAVVVLVIVYLLARKGAALAEPGWVAARRPLKVLFGLMVQLINGFSAVTSARRGLLILLVSAAIWFFQIAQYLYCATALQLPVGWRAAALITGTQALATIVPAGPGYAGSADLAAVGVLALFNVGREAALGYVNLSRASALVTLVIWGAAAAVVLKVSKRSAPAAVAEAPSTELAGAPSGARISQ